MGAAPRVPRHGFERGSGHGNVSRSAGAYRDSASGGVRGGAGVGQFAPWRFVIAARQRGVHLSVAQLIRDHLLARRARRAAIGAHRRKLGTARQASPGCSWEDLVKLDGVAGDRAAAQRQRDGAAPGARHRGGRRSSYCRTRTRREDAPLMLDEARFTAAWDRRRHPDEARLPPARRGPAVRLPLIVGAVAARPPRGSRPRHLRDRC